MSPWPPASSPDASLGTLMPHRHQLPHLWVPASPGVGSLAAIRLRVNKWARETLSGPEVPRAGAAVGTGPVYILAGTAGTQLWDGQFVWPSPLWIGQRREYGRRKLTPVGTGRLGASPLLGEVRVGDSNATVYFCLPLAFTHSCCPTSWPIRETLGSGVETLADFPSRPGLGEKGLAGGKIPGPA